MARVTPPDIQEQKSRNPWSGHTKHRSPLYISGYSRQSRYVNNRVVLHQKCIESSALFAHQLKLPTVVCENNVEDNVGRGCPDLRPKPS